ncbi:MAG TPA: Wadjet anti-phage system protein JetD domain-containing protein [Oscillospiraceae bacterium]|nr:Wadjet anti-phage system protein JetD domain-containing protein [Oscillospiraceae bacterium]
MDKIIISHLKSRKNKEIPLSEIEKLFTGDIDYDDFAKVVKSIEENNILIPVKSHKTNNRLIPLYNTYRINKSYFKDELMNEIQIFKLRADENINLQGYFSLSEYEWEKDLPYIRIIDDYIKEKGLPNSEVSSPERSYEIVGDEKWIDEKGGKVLLERLKLWDKLKISYNADPLMLAVNPGALNNSVNKHIIVENKATFYDFLDSLESTNFTSLVYGMGWKIVSGIVMLEKQLGLENKENRLFYFGDIDYEGISIWHTLNEKRAAIPAVDFYSELLKKQATMGKKGQKENIKALERFTYYFSEKEANKIKKLLEQRYYYPQEGLDRNEIREIWRNLDGI